MMCLSPKITQKLIYFFQIIEVTTKILSPCLIDSDKFKIKFNLVLKILTSLDHVLR